ncbi:MAG TPA: DUF4258 domain-containing protein [Pirellulales bacterium]|nr:DUF4258 domain-containing protein [Pirellulales bacterium]
MSAGASKPIRFSAHARGYLARRGFTEAEVVDAIRNAPWRNARIGRLEAERVFPYNSLWNGTFYAQKRVRPVFVDNPTEIVVVTVYTYFF